MTKKWRYAALSLAVSVGLMALLIKQVEPGQLAAVYRGIYVPALLAYLGLMLAGSVLRALRYKWFLRPTEIGWGPILLTTFIRNSLVDLLPARLGSLSFIYILNRRLGYTFELASSAFILAFVFDFLTLSPFVVVAVLAVGFGTTAVSSGPLLGVAIAFFLVIALLLRNLVPVLGFAARFLDRAGRVFRVSDRAWMRTARDKLGSTRETLGWVVQRHEFWPTFVLSLIIRLLKYMALFVLLFALLRSRGFAFDLSNFWKCVLGLTGAELTSALPVKGLAGFGTWESAWALTLGFLGFDAQTAILSGIGVHLVTNLAEYSLGIGSLLVLLVPFLRERRRRREGNAR
ncbi:MAG: flippase-like domain-containing protein [Candidatus Aminicenantes bacterium]|nr:flippase-like domain-containing protein [Candidatus Aminicenantes bacterium]